MKRSVSVFGALAICLWLALPSVALADNCQNLGEDERNRECTIPEKIFGFFTGVAIMFSWTTRKRDRSGRDGGDAGASPPPEPLVKNPENFASQNPAYDPVRVNEAF